MAMLKPLGIGVWLALVGAAFFLVTRRTEALAARSYNLTAEPPLARLDTRLLDVITLGHRGLWDDAAAIWTIQLLMDKRLKDVPADELNRAVTAVTRHHPRIETLYMLSCFTLESDKKRPDLCEPIILDGLKALPDSWRLPLTQAYIALDPLKDPKKATAYYAMAASRPDSPPYLKSLVNKLVAKNDLDPDDVQRTFEQLFGAGASGRMGSLLEESRKRKAGDAP